MPGIGDKLGSFPNSQIKPRSPVRESEMINTTITVGDGETMILAEDTNRIKAIIKNTGPGDAFVDYESGPSDGFTLSPGSAITVEGGGDDVFATAIGGDISLEIDNRVG